MATLITDSRHVALYDSVSGLAFGEVFEDEEQADSFLDYMRDVDGRDPRKLSPQALDDAREAWRERYPETADTP